MNWYPQTMGKTKEILNQQMSKIVAERAAVFGFFWALAHFIDEFRQPLRLNQDSLDGFLHIGVFVLAISVLFKPSSVGRLFSMSLLSAIVTFSQLPITPNHNMILLMGDLTVILGIFVYSFKRDAELKNWFYDSEPFLRVALLVTYGSAVLAKFNQGWFTTEISCATTMPAKEFDWLPFDIPWTTFWFMPFVIAGAEALIAILPLFRRTRPYGLVLAVGFHASLSLTPESQGLGFSFLLFSLLVLYLTDKSHSDLYHRGKRFVQFLRDKRIFGITVWFFMLFSAWIAYISFVEMPTDVFRFFRYAPMLGLLFVFAALIAYEALKNRKLEQVKPAIAVRHWTQAIALVLIVLNSLGPYLGYKTYASMSMYSNLSVANGSTNHLFIPRIAISGMADDIVEIIETDNEKLQNYADRRLKVTWHELRRELNKTPNASITYIRNGQQFSVDVAYEVPEFRELDPILHKLLGFRPIGEENVCLW